MSEQNNPPTDASHDRRLNGVLVILVVALIVRVVACWYWQEELSTDRDGYRAIADSLLMDRGFSADGESPTAYRPPMYPLLVAVVSVYGGSLGLAALQILLGTATVWLTYRIGREWSSPKMGLVAAGIVAVDPLLLRYTPQLMTETVFTLLVALLLFQIARTRSAEEPSVLQSIGLGVTFGLCALCRPTIWAFGGLVVTVWLTRRWRNRQSEQNRKPSFQPAIITVAAALISVAPWVIRNVAVLGQPIFMTTHGGYTLLLGNNPVFYEEVVRQPAGSVWEGRSLRRWQRSLETEMEAEDPPPETEVARDRWMFNRATSNIRSDPSGFFASSWLRFRRLWNVMPGGDADLPTMARWGIGLFYSLIFLMAILGLWRLDRHAWRHCGPAVLLIVSFTTVHLIFWSNTRMRAPLVPAIALLAARGFLSMRAKRVRHEDGE